MKRQPIILKNVRVHNLKSVSLKLLPQRLTVLTGVSGSGKSSLAFDTLYAEGQRRYVESLSNFARRYLGDMSQSDVEHVSGLSPTISIEQKTTGRTPRSTVGTLTEIYDYLRVLYARVSIPHCPVSKEPVQTQSRERIIKTVQRLDPGQKIIILAPFAQGKKAEFKDDFNELIRKGFMRARVDGDIIKLDEGISLDGSLAHDVDIVIDRLKTGPKEGSRLAESIISALDEGVGNCSVFFPASETQEELFFSMHAYSPSSGLSYDALEPHDFSFNSPAGMCDRCQGLGVVDEYHLDIVINPDLSIAEDCCILASSYQTVRYGNIYDNLAELFDFSVHTPWKKLAKQAQEIYLYGVKKKWTKMRFVHPVTGSVWIDRVQWRGVLYDAHRRYQEAKSDLYRKKMEKLMTRQCCPECHGGRLKPYPSAAEVGNKSIHELTSLTVSEARQFFTDLKLPPQEAFIAEELVKEIRERLTFLENVGLHYLSLDRTSPTLSGGEAQRVRLASQIGSGLVGVTYVLDEPSIGLHPRDNKRLLNMLRHLRDKGNNVFVVEHDEETMTAADHIIDIGPGPGKNGGELVSDGTLEDLLANENSLTGGYLSGRLEIPIPKKRRKARKGSLKLKGATHHNLKKVKLSLPLGRFIAVTGVSGSGKSSLISGTLHPALANALHKAELDVGPYLKLEGLDAIDKVIAIDQSPIGRNPRSNPSTYIKLFEDIRDLFSRLPESQARGYKVGRFSFNVKEGSCMQCSGLGMVKVDMDFMEAAWVDCSLCRGRRFDSETLSVLYRGKNIYDILEMEVGEALVFFDAHSKLKKKLKTLSDVGMDYVKLGQASTTLSGGEAQRIKLAKELSRPDTGKTLYILDEPTTGLHFHDIKHLLEVLHRLVDHGNTVLVIEHNMEVVKTADWIIDLGPEGGEAGGYILADGTPEQIAKNETPSGIAIREALYCDRKTRLAKLLKESKKEPESYEEVTHIEVTAAEQNNLKHVDLKIPRGKMTVFTGPSGSGKSSLAFETIYAEGQRRYTESLSPYARQFVKVMPKPKLGQIEGLSPAIAIEQKIHAGNPRSTVGTMTEIYDYLRILFARIGIPHCPATGEEIKAISKDYVVDTILSYPQGEKILILAPLTIRKGDSFHGLLSRLRRQGFMRIRLNGETHLLEKEEEIPYQRNKKNVLELIVDRLKVDPSNKIRILEAVETAEVNSGSTIIVAREKHGEQPFNLAFSVPSTGVSYPEITPHTFSFNNARGMCPDCQGLGYQYGADLLSHSSLLGYDVARLIKILWNEKATRKALGFLSLFLKHEGIDPFEALADLSSDQLQILMNGSAVEYPFPDHPGMSFRWLGLNNVLGKMGKVAHSKLRSAVQALLDEHECPSCAGSRLHPLARNVTINKLSISDLCAMPIGKALDFVQGVCLKRNEAKILAEVHKQILSRLTFLCDVGLEYMAMDRRAPTLSGGEAQRIRLARQLGSTLTGVLYVLDEPTIGLHAHDNERLNKTLKRLQNLGNTLILVEHDPMTISQADYLVDFGPQGGSLGGYITAKGTVKQIQRNSASLTGAYLSGKKALTAPENYRKGSGSFLSVENASQHNLKNISVQIPIGAITCITGVSGSGKSSLLEGVLLPALERNVGYKDEALVHGATIKGMSHFDRVINIDQNPIGHTVRSNVGTYVDVLTRVRDFFASLPTATMKGLQPKHFSYNHRRGMCTTCWGLGYRRIEMHFLPPVKVICDQCNGLRLNPLSLEVLYAGKNFGQILQTTVEEARQLFDTHKRITRILDTLIAVGLGYLKLGQEMASLSGGEAQRIKLSRELAKRSRGAILYLLDEPTTGLHSDDIAKLLPILHSLADKGSTLIIVEHHLDVINHADYIIDLGPGAGEDGGQIIATGTPQQIKKARKSLTGKYLKTIS